jgi:pimeloyl-ACP methyl ester carboxylesterase
MTVPFRNVDFDSASPVDEWPAEAIETIMDRGALSDWRRLADAIRRNPWGPAARTVETIAAWGEHDGVDPLSAGRKAAQTLRTRIVVVRGAGHLSMLQRPGAVARTLASFAASLRRSAPR